MEKIIKEKMEYKINQYNITDIKYKDLKGLISCFESNIPLSKISLCNFGPNIMHVKSTENKFPKTKEDKKILKSQASLILSSLNSKEKNEESNFCFSMSNNINKIYLKRFLYQINSLLQAKNRNKDNRIDGNSNNSLKQDIKEIMNFFNLISYFTCIKDEYGDEIPITDYSLSISLDKNIKYNKLNLIQFNYEYIIQNLTNDFQNNNTINNEVSNNKNNIHIFYMLIYNLPINELSNFLYCEETKDYFSIFSEEETLDDITKRFIFINQFRLLKNNSSFKLMTINNQEENENRNESIRYNINAIKSEYNFYSSLFENYLKIKKSFLVSDEDEKKIFGHYFAILLLSEFDFLHDDLISDIINRNYRELRNIDDQSLINIFSQLRNILVSDIRFNFLINNKNQIDRIKYPYLLSKLSYCLGIPEDKIIYILLTESNENKDNNKDKNDSLNKDNIVTNELSIFKNISTLINILYLKSIDKILELFSLYIKKKKLTFSNNTYKPRKLLNILLMRSNLVYNITFEKYLFSNNSFLTISDNIIDSNSFIINQNIKELLYTNYIQEKKNYIYLKNSLSLNFDKNFPKILENSEYLNSIFRENINFEEILNVYENEICGLLKLLNINENINNSNNYNIIDSKNNFNINHFKVQFNKNISRKNKIEIIDVFNSINHRNETFIKVTHSFGVFLYDLNQLFCLDISSNTINSSSNTNRNNKNEIYLVSNINKEQTINKILEYKPNDYNSSSIKYYQEKTNKIINSLFSMKKPIYITCLVELNKFNTLTLFDDMKINIIYVYYANYYNYILNINDIRQYFMQNNNINIIPKNIRNKDNFSIFKFLSKRIHITSNDYITDKFYKSKENNIKSKKYRINKDYGNNLIDFIFIKNKLSNLFENDRNISLMIYKYNYKQYIQFFCEKVSSSKFHYFIYAINGVKAFVKLTKIYKEKLILSNVRNLMTDIIVDNYDILKEDEIKNIKKNEPIFNSLSPINHKILPKIDNLDELIFDFNKEALGKMLPKLRSNLVQLKRIWKDYIYDIIYLTNNVSIFYNKENTELVIEQRMLNFQILLFLFHKNYKFINSDSIKKYGILVTEFTKTISNEVLRLLAELRKDFDVFLSENNMINKNLSDFKKTFENITFEKLILKRIELQNIINQKIKEKEGTFAKINQQKMREKNLENKNWNSNGGEETAIIEKNKKFKYNNDILGKEKNNNKNLNNNNENKFKEFSISQKDLNEGRLDNSLRMSKTRKPVSRVIESFNTVNKNSQLQLTYRNTSENNSPKTQDNINYSDIEDINMKSGTEKNKKNNNYEYKYDNVSFRNIDESSNRNIKAKIIYPNNQNNNFSDKNINENMRYNRNNNNSPTYNKDKDLNYKNNLNNNNQNKNEKFSTPIKQDNELNLNNNRNNNYSLNNNKNMNNRYNQRDKFNNNNINDIPNNRFIEINGVNNKNLDEGINKNRNSSDNKNNENIINISNNNSNNNKNIPNDNDNNMRNKNDSHYRYNSRDNKPKYKNDIKIINDCKNNKNPNNNSSNKNDDNNNINESNNLKENSNRYDYNNNDGNIQNNDNNNDMIINPIKNKYDELNNKELEDNLNNNQNDNINDSPSFSKVDILNENPNNGITSNKSKYSNNNKNSNDQDELNNKDYLNNQNNFEDNNNSDKENINDNQNNNKNMKNINNNKNNDNNELSNKFEENNKIKKIKNSNNNPNNNEKIRKSKRNSKNNKVPKDKNSKRNSNNDFNDKNNKIDNNVNKMENNENKDNSNNNFNNEEEEEEEEHDYISFKENKLNSSNKNGNEKIKNKPISNKKNHRDNDKAKNYNRDVDLNNNKEDIDKEINDEDYNDNENEEIKENQDSENEEEKNYDNNEEQFNFSWFPDEEIQKINQTLSDANEVNLEKNNPKNYITYPFEEKNNNIKLIKEIPDIIKKRVNLNIIKLMKEREIRKISSDDNINIPSLKELDKRIKQIKKEINYIDINDSIFEKLEELYFKEEDIDENNNIDYKLYNMAEEFNKEFYDDIESKLQIAEEAINNLNQ